MSRPAVLSSVLVIVIDDGEGEEGIGVEEGPPVVAVGTLAAVGVVLRLRPLPLPPVLLPLIVLVSLVPVVLAGGARGSIVDSSAPFGVICCCTELKVCVSFL